MTRILITGASGFIGRHCVPRLAAAVSEIHAVVRSARLVWPENVRVHAVNLHDPVAVSQLMDEVRPTHLLHLAWNATPGEFWTTPENLDWVAASLQMVRRFVECGGRRAVVAGTCAEYAAADSPLDETRSTCRPNTLYGASKHHLHQLLASYCEPLGVSLAWPRLFGLFGPHEHPQRIVASTLSALLAGEPVRCTSGHQVRDFLHVLDAADALTTLLQSDVTGAINIASGHPVSIANLVRELAGVVGGRSSIEFGTRLVPPHETPRVVADVTRLRDELDWSPALTLREGLTHLAHSRRGGQRAAA